MNRISFRKTRSVCPVCLKNLPGELFRSEDGSVFLEKTCQKHGGFSTRIWNGAMDFESWTLGADVLSDDSGSLCPINCGLCAEHESETCCILLEVTSRCNLNCRFCFAGREDFDLNPDKERLKADIADIAKKCGSPLLQLSGGEPTLRDDLPQLVRFAKQAGISCVQLNTNGLRLAEDPEYAKELADAGLDIVFLQFDGTTDDIYTALRDRPLLDIKLAAIEVCAENGLGVTLVPTVVPGINDHDLGGIIRLAASLAPKVRCVHFQPVSYFGRFLQADVPESSRRYTLDLLMKDISSQAGIIKDSFLPSRCDHPLCGFRSRFFIEADGSLLPITSIARVARTKGSAKDSREYVARNWTAKKAEALPAFAEGGTQSEPDDFDSFLLRLRRESLTVSAMAFQDASNLNIERLHRCSLHVYSKGKIVPFCSYYLTPFSPQ